MKNFKDEYDELLKWYSVQCNLIDHSPNSWESGLDGGEACLKQRNLDNEYRKRLKELKKEYAEPYSYKTSKAM